VDLHLCLGELAVAQFEGANQLAVMPAAALEMLCNVGARALQQQQLDL